MHQCLAEMIAHLVATPISRCKKPIRRLRPFQYDVWASLLVRAQKTATHPAGFPIANTNIYADAGFPKYVYTLAVYLWKWVFSGYDNSRNTVPDQPLCAGRLLTLVRAGLQRDVHGALRNKLPVSCCNALQTGHLGVYIAICSVIALTDNAPLMYQRSADHGVRSYVAGTAMGKRYGTLHELLVLHGLPKIALDRCAPACIFAPHAYHRHSFL
jgi:hypothetical protein